MAITLVLVVGGGVAWRVHALMASAAPHVRDRQFALTVDAVKVVRRSVPLVITEPGTVQTEHSVAVHPQVGGTLKKVLFKEGDQVTTGQLLFVIDPVPYRIAVAESKGQVEQDQAKLSVDKADAERMKQLIRSGYISAQDYENATALVEQEEGTLASDDAKLDQAQLDLSYTKIRAPISGKTGALAFKAGNLIQLSDTTPLVTINQITPIQVVFDIPQSQLPELLAHTHDPALEVNISGSNGRTIAKGGKLVFIDNTINQNSGTLGLKAEFPNADRKLWPGELVTVNLQLTVQPGQLVVPAVAVQPGQDSSYVYTVNKGRIEVHNVQVSREFDGIAIITMGLSDGDIVVLHVPRNLRQGIPAKARLLPLPTSTSPAATVENGAA